MKLIRNAWPKLPPKLFWRWVRANHLLSWYAKTHRHRFMVKRFVKKGGLAVANFFIGLIGRRLLLADFNASCHVWLDGRKRDDAWRALAPRKAGVERRGWLDVYLRDVSGGYVVLMTTARPG